MPLVRAESTVNSNAVGHLIGRISRSEQMTHTNSGEPKNEGSQGGSPNVKRNTLRNSELKRAMTPTSTHLQQPLAALLAPGQNAPIFSITPTNKNAEGGFSTLQVPFPNNTIIQRDTFESKMMQRMGYSFDISK